MAETEPNRREEIMQAALRVFARHGFHKATIKLIAREAGLKSPALIYWYFKDKDDLLRAVLLDFAPIVQQASNPAELIDQPPHQILPMIAKSLYAMLDQPGACPLLRIFLSEAIHSPEAVDALMSGGQLVVLNFMVAYFQHQIDSGRLRPHDPQSSARAFMGMVIAYILVSEVFTPLKAGLPEPDRYVEEIVSIFLHGLEAR